MSRGGAQNRAHIVDPDLVPQPGVKKQKKRNIELEKESRKRAKANAEREDDEIMNGDSDFSVSEGDDFLNEDFRDDKSESSQDGEP